MNELFTLRPKQVIDKTIISIINKVIFFLKLKT